MVAAAVAAADANGERSGKKGLFCVRSWRGERASSFEERQRRTDLGEGGERFGLEVDLRVGLD